MSWEADEFLSPKFSVLAAAQKDVCNRLSSLSTPALGVLDSWDFPVEEEVLESDLLGPLLYEQRALRVAPVGV